MSSGGSTARVAIALSQRIATIRICATSISSFTGTNRSFSQTVLSTFIGPSSPGAFMVWRVLYASTTRP